MSSPSLGVRASVTSAQPAAALAPKPDRLEAVDLLRGLIMVIMAIDHTRDYFHWPAVHGTNPLDLQLTSPAIFLTRWITHYCAPIFNFLAGTGVFLSLARGKSKRELSWFLVTRGAWLIFLELTVFTWFGWGFKIEATQFFCATLWALGTAMIALALLIHLPRWFTAAFALTLILGHNALDGIKPENLGAWGNLWRVFHAGGFFQAGPFGVVAFYPLIPWLGVMAAGYSFGPMLMSAPENRRRNVFLLGAGLTLAFVVLRASNLYGDPHPWTTQRSGVFTLLSFLNVEKYPPSLAYLLMTLGPGLMLLAAFDGAPRPALKPLLVFGRVPMFFYLLHVPLIHGLAVAATYVRFGHAEWLFGLNGPPAAPTAGWGLWVTYLVWACVVIALYPLCAWFADLKKRRRDAWLSYL